jgi:hypothetical protein
MYRRRIDHWIEAERITPENAVVSTAQAIDANGQDGVASGEMT